MHIKVNYHPPTINLGWQLESLLEYRKTIKTELDDQTRELRKNLATKLLRLRKRLRTTHREILSSFTLDLQEHFKATLKSELEQLLPEMEALTIDLACRISKHIIGASITFDRSILFKRVNHILQLMAEVEIEQIRVPLEAKMNATPQTLPFGCSELTNFIVEDPSVNVGEISIETRKGAVHSSIDDEITEVRDVILAEFYRSIDSKVGVK